MNNPKISIITPVYNVEKYLRKCLDSILSQTYQNWETILVDDGSTDQSGVICDEYAAKDTRFVVVHKHNGGVSSARNSGIEKACGEWFLFMDSDDMLYEYTLDSFINRINDEIDSVCGGYIEIDEANDSIQKYSSSRRYELLIERDDALIDFYRHSYGDMFNGYLWNRILRADIIKKNHLRFREDIYIKEDGLFLVQYFCRCCGHHLYTSLLLYKYRINPNGAMSQYDKSFNKKSLSNLYARCLCYNEIKNVTNNKHLLNLAQDAVSMKYKCLLFFFIRERRTDIGNVFRMSVVTFKSISPFCFIRSIIQSKKKRL